MDGLTILIGAILFFAVVGEFSITVAFASMLRRRGWSTTGRLFGASLFCPSTFSLILYLGPRFDQNDQQLISLSPGHVFALFFVVANLALFGIREWLDTRSQ